MTQANRAPRREPLRKPPAKRCRPVRKATLDITLGLAYMGASIETDAHEWPLLDDIPARAT